VGASTARVKVGISPMRRSPAEQAGEVRASSLACLQAADRLDAALVVAQPRRRRHDAARRSLEQLDAERCARLRDVLRDAGLGGVLALAARVNEPSSHTAMTARNLPQSDIGHAATYHEN
jgi:hypothetical protein